MDLNLSPTGGQDLFVILNIYEQENIVGLKRDKQQIIQRKTCQHPIRSPLPANSPSKRAMTGSGTLFLAQIVSVF